MYVQMNNLTTLRTGRQFRLTVHRRGPLILSYESFFFKICQCKKKLYTNENQIKLFLYVIKSGAISNP